jgi:type IV secretion system protein VirB10
VSTGNEPLPERGESAEHSGIVSVNARGSGGGNPLGKVFFVVGVLGVMLVVGLYGYNRWRASQDAKAATAKQTTKNESKPAAAGILRNFEKEQAAADLAAAQASAQGTPSAGGTGSCADGTDGKEALGPDGMPMRTAQGVAMRVCPDGHIFVPSVGDVVPPIGVVSSQQNGMARPSRYGGEALISSGGLSSSGGVALQNVGALATDPAAQAAYINSVIQQARSNTTAAPGGVPAPVAAGAPTAAAASPAGSVGSQLTPSATPMVVASMIGDRNMILPKGRSIDCGLSMRLISDLPGLASCVLSQNVYSDNGKVLLLERGSEAVGEYSAGMAQGQKRIFVLWTRIKTPKGVVINLNSPGADDLGTSGLPGAVNNHWWERLGAAVLLTVVQDAIAYKTAQASNSGTGGTLAVYQNTSQTTNNMAETILASTINIKPTLYKNQGDRGTIYVARDLDFGSVYALQPR